MAHGVKRRTAFKVLRRAHSLVLGKTVNAVCENTEEIALMTPKAITKQFVASKVCQNRNGKGEQGLWLKFFLIPPWGFLGNSSDYQIKALFPAWRERPACHLTWLESQWCDYNDPIVHETYLLNNLVQFSHLLNFVCKQPTTSLPLPNTLNTDAGVDVITPYRHKPSAFVLQNCVREVKQRQNNGLTCLSMGSRFCDVLPSFHSQRPLAQSVSLRLEEANRGLSSDMPQEILS